MSARAFRRQRERLAAAERRREQLRLRRSGLAAGAAVGAFALAPAAAQAANFEVNTLTDAAADACTTAPAGCTLRDAITAAGANSEADVITFQTGLTGDLDLTQGELATSNAVVDNITIQGPGAGVITISGDADGNGHDTGDSRILYISAPNTGATGTSVAISGLTLSGGYPTSGTPSGGAIYLGKYTHLSLDQTTVTGNGTPGGGSGAAIATESPKYTETAITDSTISDNTTGAGGSGGAISSFGVLTINNSTVSGNHAPGGNGGAISFTQKYGPLQIKNSTIAGNTSMRGGAISSGPLTGPGFDYSPQDSKITNTTISGNDASYSGGGLALFGLGDSAGSFTIDHSTISGNHATNTTSYGGAIDVLSPVNGEIAVVDSTVSGNDAGAGGGISVRSTVGANGSVSADNSTVAANTVTYEGGGLWAFSYGPSGGPYTSPPVGVNSTIVGDNTAGGSPNDLGRGDLATSGGFQLTFSLVETPTDAIDTQANSITGQDPQLGGLGSNGGPTLTMLPASSSPVIDTGSNPLALSTDQRGQPRTIDGPSPNAGDGTDIGSVERPEVAPSPSPPVTPPAKKKPKCKKKHKKKRSAESAKKKHKKCKKKKKKRR